MKKIVALAMVLALLLSCVPAMADTFSDLYGNIDHYTAILDKSTNEFRIVPTVEALTAYAIDGMTMLPAVTAGDGVGFIMLVIQGIEENEIPYNVMITTDTKVYTFINKYPDDPQMQSVDLGDKKQTAIILSQNNAVLFEEIGSSETVEVRFSTNGESFNPELTPGVKDVVVHTFELSDEVKQIFAVAHTATSKSTALMTDPMVAFAMNMVAGQAVTVTVEERATDLWD